MKTREQILTEQIRVASEAYYTTGTSSLTDAEFDALVKELESLNPDADILKKREIHTDDWNYELKDLPLKLYSIKKVKTFKEIKDWINFICKNIGISENDKQNIELVLTPKYDGIKILHYNEHFYTRYETGEQGYDVTKRICDYLPITKKSTEGEYIISKKNFELCKGYTSSRNFIPAIFSSKERLEHQDKIEYIRYSLYEDDEIYSKEEQLNICNEYNNIKVPYKIIKVKDLTEDIIIEFYFNNVSDFECDGVVIDINDNTLRNELGETQKYLDCCRAYKGDTLFDDIKESKIENITWQMSRYGKLTPVAQISPVLINEGVVTNVSLYNAGYIRDNNIFIGQRVKVARKGKINPKIVEFIDKGTVKEMAISLPTVCPFCGESLQWNETQIDLDCINKNCIEKSAQQYYYFLKTIGVKNFGLKSVQAFTYKGFKLLDFFDNEKIRNINIEGIGDITKNDFINELNKIKENGVELEKIQEASGLFEGIGAATLKTLNVLNLDITYLDVDRYYNEKMKEALNLDGIGEITAETYFYSIYEFWKWYDSFKIICPIKKIKEEEKTNNFIDLNVVFTGFRNKNWEQMIANGGGKVLSGISSSCNLLVVKDLNSTSSKMQKAKELGIKIISQEEFEKEYGRTIK